MAQRRTTLELDEHLLSAAQRALGQPTMRATVEEALRRAIETAETAHTERAERQRQYFAELSDYVDLDVLASDEMWR